MKSVKNILLKHFDMLNSQLYQSN